MWRKIAGGAPPAGAGRSEAVAFSRKMGIGWNLGNTLEATGIKNGATVRDFETGWGNPVTTRAMLEGVKKAGFSSVRVPVAWSNLIGPAPGYALHPGLLDRVAEVVGYALDSGLYVIINLHWDGGWIHKFSSDYAGTMTKYKAVWRQVAARFQNYPDRLIFESMNEEGSFPDLWNHYGGPPHQKDRAYRLIFESMNEEGSFPDLWNHYGGPPHQKDRAYRLLNQVNQAFTDLVRASRGGGNRRRYLLIAGYGTDIGRTVDPLFQMPRDPAARSMVSVHYYSPPTFAILEKDADWGKAAYTWGTPEEVAAVARDFLPLKARFLDKGIPVVVGEFGCPTVNKDPESVVKYLTTVCETAYTLGCVPMLWDIGNLYDRRALRWKFPALGQTIARIAATPR